MEQNNTKSDPTGKYVAWCFGITLMLAIISCFLPNEGESKTPNNASYSSYTPSLTTKSDGYDWNKASYSEKRSLAKKLSDIVRSKGISDCSENFYFDALNEAYDTNSSFSLSQTIDGVAGACTGMADSLPSHRRNY